MSQAADAPATVDPRGVRIAAIDVIRGAVMVLMALDHVRVYSGVPHLSADPAIFLTRWVTHSCAPLFVFLAGTSAFLHGQRHGDAGRTRRWLISRGLILVALELIYLRWAWTFNLHYERYLLAGVIWMIGWCFVLLAPLTRLSTRLLVIFGAAVVGLHNFTGLVPQAALEMLDASPLGWLWRILYAGGGIALFSSTPNLFVLYSIVPWIGVMALGFSFGTLLNQERNSRDKWCLWIGVGAILLFVVLRLLELYGDVPWRSNEALPVWMAFLNTSKYPASLLFLLMTLGPAIALVPWCDRAHGAVARSLSVLGRAPLFYYLLHIPVIHLLAILVCWIRTPESLAWLFLDHPLRAGRAPEGYAWPLWLVYSITVVAVLLLTFATRWYLRRRYGKGL